MGLTPVSANLLGLGDSALYPSGVSGSAQAATPYSATAVTPGDTATLSSSSGNAAGGTNGLYDLPSAVIFRIQLDRLAFESDQASTALTPNGSTSAASNTAVTDATDRANGDGKLRKALEALGFDPKTINEFLRLGKLLKRFDPTAYRDFVQQLENLANALQAEQSSATTPASSDTQTPAAVLPPTPENTDQTTQPANQQATQPAPAPNSAEGAAMGTPQFQVDLTSFQLTETQIQITDTQGKNGQTLDVSAETLNVSFAELQAAFAPGQEATGAPQGSGNSTNSTDSQPQGVKVNVNA